MTRLSIDINSDLHQLLKIHTTHRKESIPNTKTLSAIKELENVGDRSFDSVESLMNNLND